MFTRIDRIATGKRIKKVATDKGFRSYEIRDRLFLSTAAVFKWYSGKALPSLDNLYALSRLLGVSMDELIVPENE